MGANEIKVDLGVLDEEIQVLTDLKNNEEYDRINEIAEFLEITSKGGTAGQMRELRRMYPLLKQSMNKVIDHTIKFLENARDMHIDTDEAAEAALTNLKERIGL